MTVSTLPAAAPLPRAALLLAAAFVVAGAANTVVALTALAVGADPEFAPLRAPAYLTFTLLGLLAASVGWRLVRRFARNPARVLRILVTVAVARALVPDVALALTGFIPGSNLTGVLALSMMHVVTVAVAVPVLQRLAPVR